MRFAFWFAGCRLDAITSVGWPDGNSAPLPPPASIARAALRRPFRLLRAQRVGPFLCGYSEVPAVCGRLVLCAAVGGQRGRGWRAGRRLHARLLFCTHSNSLSHLAAGSSTNPGTRWITHARTFSSHSSPRKPGRQRHSIESADGEPAPVSAEHVWPFAHGHVLGRICSSTMVFSESSTSIVRRTLCGPPSSYWAAYPRADAQLDSG